MPAWKAIVLLLVAFGYIYLALKFLNKKK